MKESIIVFSTSWGAHHGGIDSFNHDLCLALATIFIERESEFKLVCILSENSHINEENQEADSLGIERYIVPSNISSDFFVSHLEHKIFPDNKIKPAYVLGHDVHTGQRAIDLAKHYGVKSAVFHHMNYRAYQTNQIAILKQEKVLRGSDVVFAVGPTLENSAKSILNGFKDENCVIKVIPGISSRQVIATKPPPNFSAITLGRVNLENDLIKQIRLAVAGFRQAVLEEHTIKEKQPSLTVIGLSSEDLDKAQEIFQESTKGKADGHVQVIAWPYENDRRILFDELKSKTVCMVLSWYEGFSLVGLEAISAGVPLILSKNTGLYHAIREDLEGEGIGCLMPVDISAGKDMLDNDLNQVKDCLREISLNPDLAKSNAIKLRKKVAVNWTWEKVAQQVLAAFNFNNNSSRKSGFTSNSSMTFEQSIDGEVQVEIYPEESSYISIENTNSPKEETDMKGIDRFNLNDDSEHQFGSHTKAENMPMNNVSPLIPKEITGIHEKLLTALKIANTLQNSKVISKAYSGYLTSNYLIVDEILSSFETMSFQVDIRWWNTALKLATNASNSYEESLKTVRGIKVTDRRKWQNTYQKLLKLRKHFEELFGSL